MKNTLYSAIYILHALDKKIQHKHQKSKKANVYSHYFLHPKSKKAKQYVKTYTYKTTSIWQLYDNFKCEQLYDNF
jgi:hypothetical protein